MKVKGFKGAGIGAGLKYKGRLDLGVIAADDTAVAAGVFTKNRVQAAPVLWSKKVIAEGRARAILVNAGSANACTGPEGLEDARESAESLAASIGCRPEEVLLASTGVIGLRMNMPALNQAMPDLAASLNENHMDQVASSMITTDTRPKTSSVSVTIDGTQFTVAGMAKGAGMIAPNMATMLAFIVTDAVVSREYLQTVLARGADKSFNRITVDGDTSTNDCVFALAGGQAGNPLIESSESKIGMEFERAMIEVMSDLARMLIEDGEGATKLVTIAVSGAQDEKQAKMAAMTTAESPLVKTAFFGEDANWGRLLMALGRSGASFDPEKVDISINDAPLVRNGRQAPDVSAADKVMKLKSYTVFIDLKNGGHAFEALTCDLSMDYIKINADYRS